MDFQLARIFGIDKTSSQRDQDRLLKEEFVKSASASNIDLSSLDDDSVAGLFGQYTGLYQLRQEQLQKEAQAVEMGRLLAHKIAGQMIKEAFDAESWGLLKFAQAEMYNAVEPLLQHIWKDPEAAGEFLKRVGGPPGLEGLVSKGVLLPEQAAGIAQMAAGASGIEPTALTALQSGYAKKFREGGAAARVGLKSQAQEASKGLTGAKAMEAFAPAEEGLMARFGPAGIGKALSAGDWGQVARRAGPLALGGLGLGWLWKKKTEADRERMMASAGVPMPGYAGVPAATA